MHSPDSHPPAWGYYRLSAPASHWLRILHSLPAGKAWRRLALWLRKPLKSSLPPWVDLVVWGLRLRLRSRGNLSEQRLILMPQYLDAAEREAIAVTLENGGIFFDIGANAGIYSLWVASLKIPDTRIEAFEPDPELCASLRFNLETNALCAISLNQLALGRGEGSVTLVSGDGNKGENHIEESIASSEGLAVEMTTLPTFIERNGIERIDALKIDIEGHDYDVLAPLFSQTPRAKWPRLLICEVVHDKGDRLAALLDQSGYKITASGRLNGIYTLNDPVEPSR